MKESERQQIYNDRDYFDEKFEEIDKKFISLSTKLDVTNKKIFGNGEKGLIDLTKDNSKRIDYVIRGVILIVATLVITHIQETANLIISFLKHNL